MARLSDAQVREVRNRAAAGARVSELAAEFGVGRQYIHKLVSGQARVAARNGHVPVPAGPGATAAGLEAFLTGLGDLRGEREALAAMARLLAGQLDLVAGQDSAAAASASERVAGRLADIIERLAGLHMRETDVMAAKRILSEVSP